jgi:acyl-CoA thioesterase FadM
MVHHPIVGRCRRPHGEPLAARLPDLIASIRAMTAPPLQSFELHIDLTPDDMPEDRYSTHVNNARYFAFINRTFQGWYRAMGVRGGVPGFGTMMAHVAYDFLHEVQVPGAVICRIRVVRVGNTSIEHAVEILDTHTPEPRLAGRGKAVHVWVSLAERKACPWPAEVLARCWDGAPPSPDGLQG